MHIVVVFVRVVAFESVDLLVVHLPGRRRRRRAPALGSGRDPCQDGWCGGRSYFYCQLHAIQSKRLCSTFADPVRHGEVVKIARNETICGVRMLLRG